MLLVVANLLREHPPGGGAGGAEPVGGANDFDGRPVAPPAYNYPVIPKVSSPYPMWDAGDREGARGSHAGELVLDTGHETIHHLCSDASSKRVLVMPSESWAAVAPVRVAVLSAVS